jgi:hypothetical protein
VRDEATTAKYYPEFMSPWKSSLACTSAVGLSKHGAVMEAHDPGAVFHRGDFAAQWEYPESVSAGPANQELALAA